MCNVSDTDAAKVMTARYIADEIRRGSTRTTRKAARALAEGFDVCDRQRAEANRRRMDATLSPEEREAIRDLISYTSVDLPASARIAYQVLVRLLGAQP